MAPDLSEMPRCPTCGSLGDFVAGQLDDSGETCIYRVTFDCGDGHVWLGTLPARTVPVREREL